MSNIHRIVQGWDTTVVVSNLPETKISEEEINKILVSRPTCQELYNSLNKTDELNVELDEIIRNFYLDIRMVK